MVARSRRPSRVRPDKTSRLLGGLWLASTSSTVIAIVRRNVSGVLCVLTSSDAAAGSDACLQRSCPPRSTVGFHEAYNPGCSFLELRAPRSRALSKSRQEPMAGPSRPSSVVALGGRSPSDTDGSGSDRDRQRRRRPGLAWFGRGRASSFAETFRCVVSLAIAILIGLELVRGRRWTPAASHAPQLTTPTGFEYFAIVRRQCVRGRAGKRSRSTGRGHTPEAS